MGFCVAITSWLERITDRLGGWMDWAGGWRRGRGRGCNSSDNGIGNGNGNGNSKQWTNLVWSHKVIANSQLFITNALIWLFHSIYISFIAVRFELCFHLRWNESSQSEPNRTASNHAKSRKVKTASTSTSKKWFQLTQNRPKLIDWVNTMSSRPVQMVWLFLFFSRNYIFQKTLFPQWIAHIWHIIFGVTRRLDPKHIEREGSNTKTTTTTTMKKKPLNKK